MLAERFCQSHRADHKTTSSTSFRHMRPTVSDTYRDRVKQHTNIEEPLNRKEYKCAQNYSLIDGPYSI